MRSILTRFRCSKKNWNVTGFESAVKEVIDDLKNSIDDASGEYENLQV